MQCSVDVGVVDADDVSTTGDDDEDAITEHGLGIDLICGFP